MIQKLFSCFSCGQNTSTVSAPKPIVISSNKIQNTTESNDKNNISLINSFDDEKSKTATTTTFRTTDTAPSKVSVDQEYITTKIQQVKKKDLAEKKHIQQQFIKHNLARTKVVYLVEKQWSELYTKYLRDPKIKSIRSIDNRELLDQQGRLKTNIKQKDDYFIINETVWKFVQNLYGGGPDISRDIYFPVYSLISKRLEMTPCGLQNPNNLCFMISVLQSIFSIPYINFYFYKKQYLLQAENNKKKPVHNVMYKLVKQLIQNTTAKSQQIKEFSSYFQTKFDPSDQHDAQEFFLHIANLLQQEMKIQSAQPKVCKDPESAYYFYMNSNRSIIDMAFSGQLSSTVLCKACNEESVSYVPFIDICVQIKDLTLEGCLRKHFELQKLQDLYDCEKCKKKSKAFKKQSITKTPNYLMIVLKKFTPNGKKIEQKIKYPLQLELRKLAEGHSGQTKFNLLSVIIHKGSRSIKGHYLCFTRRNKKDWIYCNDDQVYKVEETDCLGKDAYMLIYERIK